MSKWAARFGSNGAIVGFAAVAAVAVVSAGVYINNRAAPSAALPAELPGKPVAEVAPANETQEPVKAEAEVVAQVPETPPSIDEVRVESDGLTIIAGRAAPGSTILILIDGVENTRSTANSDGGFAAITIIEPTATARVLTVVQSNGEVDLASLDEIILAPVKPAPTVLAEVTTEPTPILQDDTVVAKPTPTVEPDVEKATPQETPATASVEQNVVALTPEATPDPTKSSESAATDPAAQTSAVVASASPVEQEPAPEPKAKVPAPAPVEVAVAKPEAESPTTEAVSTRRQDAAEAPVPAVAQDKVAVATVTDVQEELPTKTAAVEAPQPTPTPTSDAAAVPKPTKAPKVAAVVEPKTSQAQDVTDASTPAPKAQQITVLKSTAQGVEVLNPVPQALDTIAIDTISYSTEGDVQLAGRAQSESEVVRVYVNNRPVTELNVDAQGRWRGNLPDIDTGVYTLRVDQVDETGDVTSRVETPFKREDPVALATVDNPQALATQVTVQTGATLWAIARERYGEGRLYVQVFEANRDSIRDPDLIYPGQVFALPN
ncbi:LysM peptidoglycan-binding domain-containing protein [Tateyamaria sp.]|nr:LysM peptidoglycan-binding domain-containing protein [Tateyamaria sp.]